MPTRDDLGTRMKTFYEGISKTRLMRRCPVAIRIDGKAFHTFTRGFNKPFDEVLIESMQETMRYLCENIQGCVLGYTQSDEITLILVDYKKLNSSAWFDYEVQKMCSIASSMATMAFNKFFKKNVENLEQYYAIEYETNGWYGKGTPEYEMCETYSKAVGKGAMFDCRCFNIPKEEVTNLIYWRQLDASRNSIQMVGQANFSHKELQNKSCNQIQDMLMEQKGINWNDLPIYQKRGSCCIKIKNKIDEAMINEQQKFGEDKVTKIVSIEKSHWIIDKEIPIFKGDNRKYIDKLINVGE